MDLNTLWFLLIGVLFTGFFVLEGFDYGVGILLPFLGKTDAERRRIINTIGPVWDGNEVWMLTAGGAIFAAFPHWYATLFSGFYLALILMLVALIVRGVAFEFRSKDKSPAWRAIWDWSIFVGSAIPALLWGVALANLLKGIPIDATKTYTGGFFDLLSPYTLLAGLATLTLFITHGAIFLNLKSTDPIRARALAATRKVGPVATVLPAPVRRRHVRLDRRVRPPRRQPGPRAAAGPRRAARGRGPHPPGEDGLGLHHDDPHHPLHGATLFVSLYPRVMVSSLDPEWSLTIYNASSTPYTLRVMTVVAAIFVPIVLAYQAWTYWVFRHRITAESHLEY